MADSKLSSEQVLARSFDPTIDKLKVDAEVSATIGQVEVVIDALGGDSIAIKNSSTGNELDIEADGSINANVNISAAGGDTVALSDGVNNVSVQHLSNTLSGSDHALVTSSVIHGRSSSGGGTFVDVKVNPSGSLEVNSTVARTSSITTYTGDEAKQIDETSTANITYFGFAAPGSASASAVWKIFRINETSGFKIEYADANANYDNVWNNRTSLSYT